MTKQITDIIIKIPEFIESIVGINRTQKELLSEVTFLDNSFGCNAKNKRLAKKLGKCVRTIQRVISSLIKLGLLTREIKLNFDRTMKSKVKDVKDSFNKLKNKVEEAIKKPFKKWQKFDPKPKHDLDMIQRDGEELEDFEIRCKERESLGDVRIRKTYNKAKNNQNANAFLDLKQAFLMGRKFKNI